MILMDLQQIMIASMMIHMGKNRGKIEVNMFKHIALDSIRQNKVKFGSKYGELVIACESASNWRYGAFPYYKANRKKDREESTLDWEGIFEGMRQLREDLTDYFPYRIISVDGCEGDDVIGSIANEFGSQLPGGEPILILSGDKDFKQLQTYLNVDHYDPVRKRKMDVANPDEFLMELIIDGDSGDGIPNVLSADNSRALKIRQTTMTKKRVEEVKQQIKTGVWTDSVAQHGYYRNRELIDLTFTPKDLRDKVLESYYAQNGRDASQLFNYFMKNRMKQLMEHLNEF